MKNFVICEKASAGRDVANFLSQKFGLTATVDKSLSNFIRLGDEYVVGWCRGHLLAFVDAADYNPAWKSWVKDDLPLIPEQFKLEPAKSKTLVNGKYESKVDKGILELLKSIKTCFTEAKNIINAGDCGREGQVIVDEILDYYGFLKSKPIQRLWVNGLNYEELDKGFSNLKNNNEYYPTYRAGIVRTKTDWLFGINLTRAISINFKENGIGNNELFSAGRVQTPVITMLYERDKAIKNFKEKDFYSLSVILSNGKESITGELIKDSNIPDSVLDEEDRIIDKNFLENIKKEVLSNGSGTIKSITKKQKDVQHPKLFSLSTLQQECNSTFKISASQTLEIAQKLYEKAKMISYPRTSSNYLPKSQFSEVSNRLKTLSANPDYKKSIDLLNGNYHTSLGWNDSKVTDHHAIIPIDFKANTYSQLSDVEKKVYDIIVKRYICHLFPLKKEMEIKAVTNIGKYEFNSNSKYVISSGWTEVYDKEVGGSEIKMQEGENVKVENSNVNSKKTTPPSKFTEGTLIAAMTNISKYLPTENLSEEEANTFKKILNQSKGIGTEATRAPLLEMLKERGFMSLKNNQIDITDKGIELIENLYKINMGIICSPATTAKYELMLSQIEEGAMTEQEFMNDFLISLNSWVNLLKLNKFSATRTIKSVFKPKTTSNTKSATTKPKKTGGKK